MGYIEEKEAKLKEILDEYKKIFGKLPSLSTYVNYELIQDKMKEAIERNSPITEDEIFECCKHLYFDPRDSH